LELPNLRLLYEMHSRQYKQLYTWSINVNSGDVCTALYTVRMTVVVWTDLVILPLLIDFIHYNRFLPCKTTSYDLKSYLLNSQSLLHKPFHCSFEHSPHLWAIYWNINDSVKIMVKLCNKFGNMYNRSVWLSATWLSQNIWMAWLHKLLNHYLTPWYWLTEITNRVCK
jgi:hypothetical protein